MPSLGSARKQTQGRTRMSTGLAYVLRTMDLIPLVENQLDEWVKYKQAYVHER